MAAARAKEGTPPPVIGKAGRYTVFITPPATPKSSESPRTPASAPSPAPSPKVAVQLPPTADTSPVHMPPVKVPPVQVPPQQFEKPKGKGAEMGSAFGFFWNAVARVQNAHSSLDEYLADWLGLDQSKYQWALNDYYESKGMEKGGKPKEIVSKDQSV